MAVYNIPLNRPRPFRSASDRIKAREQADERIERRKRNHPVLRLPLAGKLSRFAARPLNEEGDSSRQRVPDAKSRSAWFKQGIAGRSIPPSSNSVSSSQSGVRASISKTRVPSVSSSNRSAKISKEIKIAKSASRINKGSTKIVEKTKSVPENKIRSTQIVTEKKDDTRILLQIEPKKPKKLDPQGILPRPQPTRNSSSIAGPANTLKVTGLTEVELNAAIERARSMTISSNTILQTISKKQINAAK